MISPKVEEILELLRNTSNSVRIRGTTPSARAFFLAQFLMSQSALSTPPRRAVVVCPNDEIATEFYSDLETLLSLFSANQYKIRHLPHWEQSPYSSIAPSIRTRHARIATFSALCQPHQPDLIVTTFAAATHAAIPHELCAQWTLHLKINDSLESPSYLTSLLLERGYQRVDLVEDPGTFSVRGEILDIFMPDALRPLRIEFFGDEIERIREFDTQTQRTLTPTQSELKEIWVPPAREVLINPTTAITLREKLKSHADDSGIPRNIRDPILSAVREGAYPDHSDTWAPFAYSHPSSLWDYLSQAQGEGPPPLVLWYDEFSCNQEWEQYIKEQHEFKIDQTQPNKLIPPVEELYPNWEVRREEIRKQQALYFDQLDFLDQHRNGSSTSHFDLEITPTQPPGNPLNLTQLEDTFKNWLKDHYQVVLLSSMQSQQDRFQAHLAERGIKTTSQSTFEPGTLALFTGQISAGFIWKNERIALITDQEVLNRTQKKKRSAHVGRNRQSNAAEWSEIQALSDLVAGDYVVHRDHGVGLYQGLVRLTLSGAPSDFIQLEYAGKDKLYLPIYRLNLVQKYVGSGGHAVLDRLGSQHFAAAKEKARESAKRLAVNLLQLYAERKLNSGIKFAPPGSDYEEFSSRFPFDETADQSKAIQDVLTDLESGKMMDRLICGDVGYGKTEVAIRAAFLAVSEGKQVVVLVPTTILALQHEQTFKARFRDFPFLIESITRFKPKKDQKETLKSLADGKIDIIVGTHRLLSRDVTFRDLGLLIIDEEHRFGVEHKEKLKALKVNTHVLTLTATPIPRTLHMSLSGLRDISLINTPPVDRLPIRTFVSKYDESIVQKAIEFELARGGQVFYLHNRVQTIEKAANQIRELSPKARVIVAHGQMEESVLEKTIAAFYQKEADVLVTTTIIESGLDLPNANTILITRADTLGLAQLYQVRGRVGRGQQRGYAYLFIPEEGLLSGDALKRLEVIQKFVELGSGFNIASHDLEIRGGGDLLGPQQSGNIGAVGFELYMELLDEAIHEIRDQPALPEPEQKEPEIRTPFPAFFSEDLVPDVRQRLSLYRRFSASRQESEIDVLEEEMRDRFGALPPEAQNLIWLIRIKLQLKNLGILSLNVGSDKISLLPGPTSPFDPAKTIALLAANPQRYQLTPDSRLIVKITLKSLQELFFALDQLVKDFSPGTKRS